MYLMHLMLGWHVQGKVDVHVRVLVLKVSRKVLVLDIPHPTLITSTPELPYLNRIPYFKVPYEYGVLGLKTDCREVLVPIMIMSSLL